MLLNKSLLLLVTFIFAIVAISSAAYTEFKLAGAGCETNAVYTAKGGACQGVCGFHGKLLTTASADTFTVEMFNTADCSGAAVTSANFTCLPDNKPVQISPALQVNVTCIATTPAPTDSSSAVATTATFSVMIAALLFALL